MSRAGANNRLPDEYDPVALARVLERIQRAGRTASGGAGSSSSGPTTIVGGVTVEGAEIPDPLVVQVVRGTHDVLIGNISARVYDIAGFRPGNLTNNEEFLRHILARPYALEEIRISVGSNPSADTTISVAFGSFTHDFVVDNAGAIDPAVPYAAGAAIERNSVITASIDGNANGISDIAITISGYWLLLNP